MNEFIRDIHSGDVLVSLIMNSPNKEDRDLAWEQILKIGAPDCVLADVVISAPEPYAAMAWKRLKSKSSPLSEALKRVFKESEKYKKEARMLFNKMFGHDPY